MARGQLGKRIAAPAEALRAAPAPRRACATSSSAAASCAVGEIAARIGAMQMRPLRRAGIFRVGREGLSARASPRCRRSGADRAGPRAPASATARRRRQAKPQQRMLEQASSVTGASPSRAASAASRAKMPAGVSASASPPESSAAMFQRASAASTRRPSARSGVTSAAVLPFVHRFAQRDRDRERLLLGVGRFDHRQCVERRIGMRRESRIGGVLPPHFGRRRRPQRFRDQPFAAARRRQEVRPRRARCRCV